MGDINEDDLEFRGGTLQLSTDHSGHDNGDNNRNAGSENLSRVRPPNTTNPSVLSGANSLSSSSTSVTGVIWLMIKFVINNPKRLIRNTFKDARTGNAEQNEARANPTEEPPTVYPRYDVPFNKENIQDFFTFRKGVVEAAIQECITILLFPEDGEYLGSWLLTEITLWDNEKERIVLLTSRLVMTIKYDFIAMKQLDFKKTYLDDLDTIVIGELVYPPSSLVPRLNGIATGVTTVVKDCVIDRLCRRPPEEEPEPSKLERNLRGVRLMWNKGEPLPMKTVWNPFSQDVPFITFASHPIFWHKAIDATLEERATYDMETFAVKLQRAIEAMQSSSCCIQHAEIVIQSYVGVTSLLHNKTGMGFFKCRGKFSF
ncbi:tumor protein p63-regulated gene 1-like protein isoform X2 [Plutella xylostella]|uniref:tumor protein p63-regulated gene 1-like protein isoform X2 n=1 Tax=Plutella xylostella TaxID=51655 RepID=UPI0020322F8C|nr:tumor protein p63-regulated gene 1-like protein isoform X2 [Plutella xylostella]